MSSVVKFCVDDERLTILKGSPYTFFRKKELYVKMYKCMLLYLYTDAMTT